MAVTHTREKKGSREGQHWQIAHAASVNQDKARVECAQLCATLLATLEEYMDDRGACGSIWSRPQPTTAQAGITG